MLTTEKSAKKFDMNLSDLIHSKCIIDQLHAIGNAGNAFACLSGSSWKLVNLAHRWREKIPRSLMRSHPCIMEYQSLNN